MKSQVWKNYSKYVLKMCFFGSCDFFNFFFSKNPPDYIDPSGHFVFYEILCRSNFYNSFFSIVEKINNHL